MNKYQGKKILFLGTNAGTVDLVKYAKDQGAWIAVADYLPEDQSEAKLYADDALLISTADKEVLAAYCKEQSIDCVYAGISEFNLERAIELSEELNLPFYCTKSQWDAFAKKDSFRKLCLDAGVPAPQEFYVGDQIDQCIQAVQTYPVMVKPVDGTASAGVFFCSSKEQVKECFPKAFEASVSSKVIVEEFLEGPEFTVHYTVVDGQPILSSVDNRYPVAVHEGDVTTIPAARIYPSLFLKEYQEQVDPFMKKMITNLDLDFGVVFAQGIYSPALERFGIFEGGLRGAGERPYRLISATNGCDYATMVLDSMVLGHDKIPWQDDVTLSGKTCAVVSLVGRHGTVEKVQGIEDVLEAFPEIIECEIRYPEGATIPDTDTLRQLAVRFFIVCNDREQLANIISKINERVSVVDKDGNSLVVTFDPERVFGLE